MDTRRGSDPTHPKKTTKLQGSIAILVWNPRKFTKLPKQHSMLGQYQSAWETSFK